MSPYDRAHTTSCLTLIETVCLSFTVLTSYQVKLMMMIVLIAASKRQIPIRCNGHITCDFTREVKSSLEKKNITEQTYAFNIIFQVFCPFSCQIKLLTNNKSFSDTNNLYLSYSLKTRLVIPKKLLQISLQYFCTPFIDFEHKLHRTHDTRQLIGRDCPRASSQTDSQGCSRYSKSARLLFCSLAV